MSRFFKSIVALVGIIVPSIVCCYSIASSESEKLLEIVRFYPSSVYPNIPPQSQQVRAKKSSAARSVVPEFTLSHDLLSQEILSGEETTLALGSHHKAQLTINAGLQAKAKQLLNSARVPWGAVVIIEPATGKVVAYTAESTLQPQNATSLLQNATYPAASLFKIVTAASVVEQSGLTSDSKVAFSGGHHSSLETNYLPNEKRDRYSLTLAQAMGKSSNPIYARVGVKYSSAEELEQYTNMLGFNSALPFDLPVASSVFSLKEDDKSLARTSAGFGDAFLSPLHAALLVSALANQGVMMKPFLFDQVQNADGEIAYENTPTPLRRVVLSSTAAEVLTMMKETVQSGTAKRAFRNFRVLSLDEIAAKTGTLRGDEPKGLYRWFVGAAPISNPEVVVAVLVIEPTPARMKSAEIARHLFEYYFSLS